MNIKERIVGKVNRHLLRKYFTIMLVPHSSEKSIHINVTMWFIYCSMACFIFVMSVAGFILSRHFDYSSTRIAEKTLKDKVQLFSKQLIETQAYIESVKDVETKMKTLLGLKSKQAIIENAATGGPLPIEAANIDRFLRNDYLMSDIELKLNLELVIRKLTERLNEWNKMKSFIVEQNRIFNATPSLIPVYGRITSFFGERVHPLRHEGVFHQGIDIGAYRGTPIRAAAPGIVTYSNWAGGYGKLVVISHGYGYSTRYAHMARIKARLLQRIKKGEVLGYIGSTGTSTGDHLHYEVRLNECAMNPIKFLRKPRID